MSSIKEFEVLSTLGAGTFSSVYKVKRISDGQEYALKRVKLPSLKAKEKENALNEVRILASIEHASIIGYKQAFYDDHSQSLCIIMEYASGGDLNRKINEYKKKNARIPEDLLWTYLIQMTQGLKALHDMKILHRDLKSANVFLGPDGKTAKLGDLNVSKITEQGLAHTQAGTPYYASPEVWQNKPYGPKSDVWSLGVVMYELCTFLPPFRAPNMNGLFQKITRGSYDKIPSCYSQELSKVIATCLTVQVGTRASCEKILSHPIVMTKMTEEQACNGKKIHSYNDILDTIRMPRNLKNLTEMLPKSNYKNREVVSLMDLDAPNRQFEVPKERYSERPQTRMNRLDSKLGIKDPREDSLERSLKTKDIRRSGSVTRKQLSLPPTDPLKKTDKVTPMQRAAKAVLGSDVFDPKKNSIKASGSIFTGEVPLTENIKRSVVSKQGDGIRGIY